MTHVEARRTMSGLEFFRKESSYSSRKHAILTVFQAIELFLKEHLFRTNPILIYRNIDARIAEDSLTVGIRGILIRFENIGLRRPKKKSAVVALSFWMTTTTTAVAGRRPTNS